MIECTWAYMGGGRSTCPGLAAGDTRDVELSFHGLYPAALLLKLAA